MIPLFPLVFGAAILVLGKKRKRSTGKSGSLSGVKKAKLVGPLPVLQWNDDVARQAREIILSTWETGDKQFSSGKIFLLMRDTAMELWSDTKWPTTMNDEAKMINVSPGWQIPTWVYNLGDSGPIAQDIWWKLRSIVWDVMGYVPPT